VLQQCAKFRAGYAQLIGFTTQRIGRRNKKDQLPDARHVGRSEVSSGKHFRRSADLARMVASKPRFSAMPSGHFLFLKKPRRSSGSVITTFCRPQTSEDHYVHPVKKKHAMIGTHGRSETYRTLPKERILFFAGSCQNGC